MSIATKTGDDGTTGLMYNHRVSKCHPRVEACGSLDELNTALGLARATAGDTLVRERLLEVEKDLVILMGELATLPEDLPRYVQDGFTCVTPEHVARLDDCIRQLEAQSAGWKGWAMPGANLSSATLDVARTACRRAERRVCALQESGGLKNPETLAYLNRLADALWLLARGVENHPA